MVAMANDTYMIWGVAFEKDYTFGGVNICALLSYPGKNEGVYKYGISIIK